MLRRSKVNKKLENKLKKLPVSAGVYFHKDKSGEIIYVGKAAVLKNRVRQYFQNSKIRDSKTEALISEITDVDWMEVDSEIEALFLEAEMIRRYLPRYNILLRDDKSLIYIRIDIGSDYPTVSTTRRPLDDKALYFGPYISAGAVRNALRSLRKIFPYATKKPLNQKRASLEYHLGLDPGLEENKTTLADYRANLRKLIAVIEGKKQKIARSIKKDMQKAAKAQNYEEAAKLRNQYNSLVSLNQQVIFSDKEFEDISKDHALNELVEILNLKEIPRRIEGYDISHMQGSDVVASMVVFTNGISNKGEYRKFKTKKNINDDFYNMNETIKRRLSPKNIKAWGLPSLLLIDGGKGQLDAALRARDESNQSALPAIGLAKREEQLVISTERSKVSVNEQFLHKMGGYSTASKDYILINIPHNTNLIKLLQRIRDESHRFAVSYHSVLKSKRQTSSILDDIPGIGPKTRRKLLKDFGSLTAVKQAGDEEIIKSIGPSKAALVLKYLK